RAPVARKIGAAAATIRPHIAHPAPDGPDWKRTTSPRLRSLWNAKPSEAASRCRIAYVSGHGKRSTTDAHAASTAIASARADGTMPRANGAATTKASAHTTNSAGATG